MYIMWWHKPLLPHEPITLTGDWVEPLFAFMYMCSQISGESGGKKITKFATTKPEMEELAFCGSQHTATDTDISDPPPVAAVQAIPTESEAEGPAASGHTEPESKPSPIFRLASKTSHTELHAIKRLARARTSAFFERRPQRGGFVVDKLVSLPTTAQRWSLAASAIAIHPAIRKWQTKQTHHGGECIHFKSEELLVRRVRNWPGEDLLRNVNGLVVGMTLWLASFAYGAIHAAVWHSHFPTLAEKWLWRSSSAYISWAGGLWIVLNGVAQMWQPLNAYWEGWMEGKCHWWDNVLIGATATVCGVSFLLARGFLVVEAFLSIRQLPAAAYETPNWTQVFPHF